jgi:hypothetical protein
MGGSFVKPEKNRELAKLIGRRLRDACERHAFSEFPAAVTEGLAKIRQAETSSAADVDIFTLSDSCRPAPEYESRGADGAPPSK